MRRPAGLLLGALVLLAACSHGTPRPAEQAEAGDPTRTVFLGDSITAASPDGVSSGAPPALSWVGYALADPGSPWRLAANAAVSGETLEQIALRYADAVRSTSATQLVLMGGTNDVIQRRPLRRAERALRTLLEQARADGLETWVIAPPPLGAQYGRSIEPMRRMQARVCREVGVTWVDVTSALEDADGGWRDGLSDDDVHPTRLGAQVLGEAVAEAVRQ